MIRMYVILLLLLLCFYLPFVKSLQYNGYFNDNVPLLYATSFAFPENSGIVRIVTSQIIPNYIEVDNEYLIPSNLVSPLNYLLVLVDTNDEIQNLYNSVYLSSDNQAQYENYTCVQKMSLADYIFEIGLDLTIPVEGSRTHFWYFVVFSCNDESNNNTNYIKSDNNIEIQNVFLHLEFQTNDDLAPYFSYNLKNNFVTNCIALGFLFLCFLPWNSLQIIKWITTTITKTKGFEFQSTGFPGFLLILCYFIVIFQIISHGLSLSDEIVILIRFYSIFPQMDGIIYVFEFLSQTLIIYFIFTSSFHNMWHERNKYMKLSQRMIWSLLFSIFCIITYIYSIRINPVYSQDYIFNNIFGYLTALCMLISSILLSLYLVQEFYHHHNRKTRFEILYMFICPVYLLLFPIKVLVGSLLDNWYRERFIYPFQTGIDIVMILFLLLYLQIEFQSYLYETKVLESQSLPSPIIPNLPSQSQQKNLVEKEEEKCEITTSTIPIEDEKQLKEISLVEEFSTEIEMT